MGKVRALSQECVTHRQISYKTSQNEQDHGDHSEKDVLGLRGLSYCKNQ